MKKFKPEKNVSIVVRWLEWNDDTIKTSPGNAEQIRGRLIAIPIMITEKNGEEGDTHSSSGKDLEDWKSLRVEFAFRQCQSLLLHEVFYVIKFKV